MGGAKGDRGLTVTYIGGFLAESRTGYGEDHVQALISGRRAVIACMDGCGGSGARRYPRSGGETGARIASRAVREAIGSWFSRPIPSGAPARGMADNLKAEIDEYLRQISAYIGGDGASRLKSRLSHTLPTTLAMTLVETGREPARAIFIWAGDSRAYHFPADGLRQMTKDDIVGGGDAQKNLTDDGIMSNVICASGAYRLNVREIEFDAPCLFLTATDGCFAYFLSPIDFEGVLLDTMQHAETPAEWERLLRERIGRVASDDFSLQILITGRAEDSFSDVRQRYQARAAEYERRFGAPLEALRSSGDSGAQKALWEEYRRTYSAGSDADGGQG